ncbi:MAG: sigma-54-dependent transcriptional regulator [Planctomycetota bacterium]
MKGRVLVVDDEVTAREELCEALQDDGFLAHGVDDAQVALDCILKESYDVCISDIRMPGMDGIALLRKLNEISPETMVIMITAYGGMETAIEALRSGATDYVLKPVIFEDILGKVRRLVEHRSLILEVRNLRRAAENHPAAAPGEMIGDSSAMREIGRLIAKVAPTASNVLITGESGTGKELIARSIHGAGEHQGSPFVPINCAAIPETLLESELFGHTKGSFTGAIANKEGLLRTAGDGTIFLDEIGDMPMAVQAKLLRAIENREIQPLGSVRRIPIHARIIAATNKDLQTEIAASTFREDLYYRLAVVEFEVPPLRDRREDIPLLVNHFVEKYNRIIRRSCAGVDSDALRLLIGYGWRGNIRELENWIERALILADTDLITAADLPSAVRAASPMEPSDTLNLNQALRRFERSHISTVLERCDGDKRHAAQLLGLSLSTLYRKLEPAAEES